MGLTLLWTTHVLRILMVIFAAHFIPWAKGISGCQPSHSITVKCVKKDLTVIPSWIPLNVVSLDLSGNPLRKMREDFFTRFTNLKVLRLGYCGINQRLELPRSLTAIELEYNSISMDNVAAMFRRKSESQIERININGNNLMLDGNISIFPRSVKRLYLNGNILSKIESNDFEGLANLTHLDISNTGLRRIAKGAFKHLKQLTYIRLNDNNITELPKKIFELNPEIHTIDIGNNKLKILPDLRGIRQLTRLRLIKNKIKMVEGHTIGVRSIFHIDLESNEIEYFNLTGVKYHILDLTNNRISHINKGSLGDNPQIHALLLQRNNLKSLNRTCFQGVQRINDLHLQLNRLEWIEKGIFHGMKIHRLLLFKNKLIHMNGVLEGMSRLPKLLLLFGNPNITFLRATDYQNMTADSEIYISCRSFRTFSSPLILKAKLICSPTSGLVISAQRRWLEGGGFTCNGRSSPYKCSPCEPGSYDAATAHVGFHRCIPCPFGAFYQDEMASIQCKNCSLGQYVPPGKHAGKSPLDCITCPKGTNTNSSAGYRACHCLPGYSRRYRFGACEKCSLDGFDCQKKDYPILKKGYWMSWDNSDGCKHSFKSFMSNLDTEDDSYNRDTNNFKCILPIAHKCPINYSCDGGVEATCNKGYVGVLCAVCARGYMKQFNKCVACSSPVVSLTECMAYFLSFVILCWLMSKLDKVTLAREDDEKTERTFADLIQSSLKIVMGFYQVLVRIINAFKGIEWPNALTHAVKLFEFVELSVLKIPSLHCIRSDWRLNAIGEFWISLIAMVTIPSLLLIYFALKAVMSYCCVSKETCEKKWRISLKHCLQSIVLFFFATYPFISTNIFHVLPAGCHTFCTVKENGHCLNKMSYLRNDYSVKCPSRSGDPNFNLDYAYVSLLLPVGLPVLLLYLLWKFAPKDGNEIPTQRSMSSYCEDLEENENQYYVDWEGYNAPLINSNNVNPETNSVAAFALKMTYGNYKTSCWYWEFIEMVRKLVMVAASSFLLENLKIGLYSNILLSIFFVVLHARKWPMKDSFDNYMQLLALVSVTVNLCYSVTKASSIGDSEIMDKKEDDFGLGLMLVCLNSLLVILIVGRFLKEVALKMAQKLSGGCCSFCCTLQCCILQHRINESRDLSL